MIHKSSKREYRIAEIERNDGVKFYQLQYRSLNLIRYITGWYKYPMLERALSLQINRMKKFIADDNETYLKEVKVIKIL